MTWTFCGQTANGAGGTIRLHPPGKLVAARCGRCGYETCGGAAGGDGCDVYHDNAPIGEVKDISGRVIGHTKPARTLDEQWKTHLEQRGWVPKALAERVGSWTIRAQSATGTGGSITLSGGAGANGIWIDSNGRRWRAFSDGSMQLDEVPQKPVEVPCDVRLRSMADTAKAFAAMAEAMETPRGRRILAQHAIEDAVSRCPPELNRDALRAALMFQIETLTGDEPDRVSWYCHYAAGAILDGKSHHFVTEYHRAVAALRAPALRPRPTRWSGGRR